jgi:hypothetical protein
VPSHLERIDGTSYVLLDPESDALFRSVREATMPEWAAANPKWVNAL